MSVDVDPDKMQAVSKSVLADGGVFEQVVKAAFARIADESGLPDAAVGEAYCDHLITMMGRLAKVLTLGADNSTSADALELAIQELTTGALYSPDDEFAGSEFRNEYDDAYPDPIPGTAYTYVTDALYPNGQPAIDDIDQSAVEDCWLLAVLGGAVAGDPSRITKMIDPTDEGFVVTFPDGEKVTVDRFFAGNSDNAVWVRVLEKAYAFKRQPFTARRQPGGDYGNIETNTAAVALRDLFGTVPDTVAPAGAVNDRRWYEKLVFDVGSTVWDATAGSVPLVPRAEWNEATVDEIESTLGHGKIVTASIFAQMGISGGHDLTVTSVVRRVGKRYVEARNPWANNKKLKNDAQKAGVIVDPNGRTGYLLIPEDQINHAVRFIHMES